MYHYICYRTERYFDLWKNIELELISLNSMCENGLKIFVDPDNLFEFNGNESKSLLSSARKTIDYSLKYDTN